VFELKPTEKNGSCLAGFHLSPTASNWCEGVLYSFAGSSAGDGANPQGGLVMDGAGNLYGTTNQGGSNNLGTVFELTPTSGGGWTETVPVLHSFAGSSAGDGAYPVASLIYNESSGILYGTTAAGGSQSCGINSSGCGVMFQVQLAYELTVTVSGNANGTVRSAPQGISCPGQCTAYFVPGEQVRLLAGGVRVNFDNWTWLCSGRRSPCVVTMNAAGYVGATFFP